MTPCPHPAEGPRIVLVDWADHADALSAVRTKVFVLEQNVPAELELDGLDPHCTHAAALHGERVVATGRLLPSARIGRMAVLKSWRGHGVGAGVLAALVAEARRRGHEEVRLAAQSAVVDFYRRQGFSPRGNPFMEAGIEHIEMVRRLDPSRPNRRDE